jgi:hypothetical protein
MTTWTPVAREIRAMPAASRAMPIGVQSTMASPPAAR